MAKTFLDLVVDLWRESGASGAAPSTVTGQSGERGRLVEWVKMADLEIQNMHLDWKFLWAQKLNLTLVAGTAVYNGETDLRHYDRETFKITPVNSSQAPLEAVDYLTVRGEVLETEQAEPDRVIILPDDRLQFDQVPDAAHVVAYDYYKYPTQMTENTDESSIPDYYRYGVIVGKALEYYANYEDADEALRKSSLLLGFWLPELEAQQLPGERYMHAQAEGSFHQVEVE